MSGIIEEIKKYNNDLSYSEIEGLLYVLKNSDYVTNTSLITKTGIPKETLSKFKKTISGYLEGSNEDKVCLNSDGIKMLETVDVKPHRWSLAENMQIFPSDSESSLADVGSIKCKFSPKPKREYDQFLATSRTSLLKAKIINEKGAVKGMSIAFIGDDDLVSMSLASETNEYKDITVFDVDEEILGNINRCSKERDCKNIKVEKYDVRNNIDSRYFGRFDTVVFDPPYTKSGVFMFLTRAVELLKKTDGLEGKYIFMYYGNSFKSPEKILKIQELINRFGLSIEDRIEKFARYSGAESIGNSSSLYILKTNKFTRTPSAPLSNIYTFENIKEEKFPFVDHLVFKVTGVGKEILLSKSKMLSGLEKICQTHRLKVIDKNITEFKRGGLTISFVLSQSNLTVHTWAEFGALHIDLITCSPIHAKDSLPNSISDVFLTKSIETFYVD